MRRWFLRHDRSVFEPTPYKAKDILDTHRYQAAASMSLLVAISTANYNSTTTNQPPTFAQLILWSPMSSSFNKEEWLPLPTNFTPAWPVVLSYASSYSQFIVQLVWSGLPIHWWLDVGWYGYKIHRTITGSNAQFSPCDLPSNMGHFTLVQSASGRPHPRLFSASGRACWSRS